MTSQAPRAERKSNFFLGFILLPRAKREALSAVYAYCRLIDDIVDSPDIPQEEARSQLDFWRAEVDRLYAGRPTHPISQALAGPIAEFKIPKEPFLEMIRGCAMDLEDTRYETITELESYMRGVASSVGVMCVHIFGWDYTARERMMEFARDFGYAFQLTNIIRDVGADLELGRVYLPLADLREAGYSEERLLAREPSEAFQHAMRKQHARAKEYYARARGLVDFRDRPRLLPAEVMGHVYEGLLDEIARGGFSVLFQKARLSSPRKLVLALRAWLYCHGF
ncbi:MAG: squalene synthase HpnD [Elusimicrobia bacterium RIFOXYD12_FULL_66_9]|nr:MAG: squalene synthase HpnD [Elusimicrobia bacterium RIFOXYD12_FULL_66_9]